MTGILKKRSIRLKLTLTYSAIVFIFCSLFVFSINITLRQHFNRPPEIEFILDRIEDRFENLPQREKDRIDFVRQRDLERIHFISILSLIPLSALSILIGYYLSGEFLSPLKTLSDNLDKTEANGYNQKLHYSNPNDEIGQLVTSYNKMIERIDKTFKLQTQFIQDASHEIKTPLAIIQTNIDTLITDEKATKDDLKRGMKIAINGVETLNSLVDELLSLSRSELGKNTKFDIIKLVNAEIDKLSDKAQYNDKTIGLIIPEISTKDEFTINANRELVQTLVSNLITNAIEHSTSSEIIAEIKTYRGNIHFSIENEAKNLSDKNLNKIFDRFYKSDKSRSQNKGHGIGLSVVKKIVDEHEWKIKVDKNDNKFKIRVII